MNYYKHHLGDYAKDTMGLSQGQHGAYRLLMDATYASEDGIAVDEVYDVSKARSVGERANTDRVIGKFFTLRDGRYYQKRIESEIEKYREKAKKASESALHRWSEGNADAMRSHKKRNASHKPVTNNQEKAKAKAARARETHLPEGFEISERVKTWATSKGFAQLERYLEFFIGRMKANGKTYIDWDEAFMNCIREDWPKFRQSTVPDYSEVIARIQD